MSMYRGLKIGVASRSVCYSPDEYQASDLIDLFPCATWAPLNNLMSSLVSATSCFRTRVCKTSVNTIRSSKASSLVCLCLCVFPLLQEQAIRNSSGLSPGPLESLVNTPLSHLNLPPACDIPVPCAFFHPGQTCHGHALSLIPYVSHL